MGYAGYAPGNRIADKLTPLQQALRAMPLDRAMEALELIEKLTRNVVRNPSDEKYRKIKLTNPKVSAAITTVPFAVDALKEMGWVEDGEELVLPADVKLAHERDVVAVIDARDYYKKEEENERRRQARAIKSVDAEKEELLKKMEADRKEKAAEGPVVQGSVAKQLGDGPNVVRASDVLGTSMGA